MIEDWNGYMQIIRFCLELLSNKENFSMWHNQDWKVSCF